jgi:hypothetical protein
MVTNTEADENGYGYRGRRKWLRIQRRMKMVTDTDADENGYGYRGG